MIGFNGQYLSAAIGDMRITAMSQGDKWLLGSDWLLSATKAAILSAFGAEGAGVIQATNAYLNAIAATDREKAQRLANCINEDPMLVTSIVETSKTRLLVGDGKSYFNLGKKCTTFPMKSEIKFRVLEHTQEYYSVCCNRQGNYRLQLAGIWEDKVFLSYGTSYTYIHNAYELNKDYIQKYEFTSSATKIWLNDEFLQKEASRPNNLDLLAFARQYDNAIDGICPDFVQLAYINLHEKGHFVPFKRNGEMELLDIVTGTLATRVGTFTEIIEDKP